MFIINPDQYTVPTYRISPFNTSDITRQSKLRFDNHVDGYFKDRFQHRRYFYLKNGRTALNVALGLLGLHKDDVISILTTSGNFYISGCVTSEIEKFCGWSREITKSTKAILVNHEFGIPYDGLLEIKEYNLPIIEDCAYSFFSVDDVKTIGTVGDFVIYSFPKMFPIQIGGLLVSRNDIQISGQLESDELSYVKKVLSYHIRQKHSIIDKRLTVYKKLSDALSDFGFTERFKIKANIVPGVFLFRVNNEELDLDKMKAYLWKHGIQCSVFYGERAFFIPAHQNLTEEDILYFKAVIQSFIEKSNLTVK